MQRVLITAAAVCLLAACGDSSISQPDTTPPDTATPPPDPITPASFDVSATNLTLGQPLSPLAVLIHDSGQAVFRIGETASAGLELLAEGGDNSGLLDEIDGAAEASGGGPIGPGGSETLTLELADDQTDGLSLSVISMLVNTNDAITGLNGIPLADMAVGDSMTYSAVAYDAGTEANNELAGTIPGPADGGEGFNAMRDDVGDFVTMHPGVVTADDGLSLSVLNQMHRFDNPVIRITVTRTQ
ncbi:MAG: spondin domain-containing protein [Pseudomonadota bacterium]